VFDSRQRSESSSYPPHPDQPPIPWMPGIVSTNAELNTHHHLVAKLGTCGAIPAPPQIFSSSTAKRSTGKFLLFN
jgi:hypothetical protein